MTRTLGLANAALKRTIKRMDLATEYAETGEPPPAIPAATLVIFRNAPDGGAPQILMVQRSHEMRFAGGAAVFPGGRIDPADFALAEDLGGAAGDHADEWAARIAAVRETLEETGLVVGLRQRPTLDQARQARDLLLHHGALAPVLSAMDWELDLAAVVPFARWRPKHRHLRIFDTRFYLANLGTGAVDLLVDQTENSRLFWISAADALRQADSGEIMVIFPTRRNLERLAQFDSFSAAAAQAEQIPVQTITPFVEQRGDGPWLMIPENAGYPVLGERLESAARGG